MKDTQMKQSKRLTAMGSLFFRDDDGNLYMPVQGATIAGAVGGLFEKVEMEYPIDADWRGRLSEREQRLVANCIAYAANDPAGLPGHNLTVVVAKMSALLDDLSSAIMWSVNESRGDER